jgi:periplasmic glucans biosynthesis protein
MRRRDILLQAAVLPVVGALGCAVRAEESTQFNGGTVRNLARDLAQRAFQAPDATLPDELKNLEYQDYRSICFDPGHALWSGQGLRFTAEFFHRGFLYKEAVRIFEVVDGHAEPIRYSPDLFTFGKVKPPSADVGFAGFRRQRGRSVGTV